MTALLVALGAGTGAALRYLTDRAVRDRRFPWGTLAVNVAGSFVLGALLGLGVGPVPQAALGAGFCGGLTTYSTFGYETVALLESGEHARAAANVLAGVAAGVGAAAAGWALAAAL